MICKVQVIVLHQIQFWIHLLRVHSFLFAFVGFTLFWMLMTSFLVVTRIFLNFWRGMRGLHRWILHHHYRDKLESKIFLFLFFSTSFILIISWVIREPISSLRWSLVRSSSSMIAVNFGSISLELIWEFCWPTRYSGYSCKALWGHSWC